MTWRVPAILHRLGGAHDGCTFQRSDLEMILQTLQLPSAPAGLSGPVKAWRAAVSMPTWEPLAGERNPMFLEKRVYQGSSGRVYPLPFIDRIAEQPTQRAWQAIHLENEYLRVMILPELGGRIHVARDKTNGYDFIYRQDVIKPALVGLAGPWVSGGIEFNWPQHHRPGTYLPVESAIEAAADGSVTVWLSSLDPLSRMKGMHGVCLHPGKSYIELKARLYNATPMTQTFLWWANVATEVSETYQSFFPEDVQFVADHAKRAVSTFPLCDDKYYGVNYGERARSGVPESESPRQFRPQSDHEVNCAANDLSWFANIPVPTSYMCMGTQADFFGGYDHGQKAGIVHVANHHIAPGKKQWCWGNHEFGYAWDRHLTEPDAQGVYRPYIELMAGVYTDNQPDFSFLAPGDTRAFSQYWFPIREIGPACQANTAAAVSLAIRAAAGNGKVSVRLGVAVTERFADARIELRDANSVLAQYAIDLSPDHPWVTETLLPADTQRSDLVLRVYAADGRELIAYRSFVPCDAVQPRTASEPPAPADIVSNDELFLTGVHLEQYRHATRAPELYWREALRRDPYDARCNNALGFWLLRRGEFAAAEAHFRHAIERLTLRNPNPLDGEAFYNLGLCLRYQGRDDEAYGLFYKATWNAAWRAAGYLAIAEIDASRAQWALALVHLAVSLRHDTDNLHARNLKAIALRELRQSALADEVLAETLQLDPLDVAARYLSGLPLQCDSATRLDLAIFLMRSGLHGEAGEVLEQALPGADAGTRPMLHYYLALLAERSGQAPLAAACRRQAMAETRDYCFPSRLEDLLVLEDAIRANPDDAAAHYYLGNLLYDKRRHREAIVHWETSVGIDPAHPTAWRNLGIGRFNILGDPAGACEAYERAMALDPDDARVLYERDQLWKRVGVAPRERLAELRLHAPLIDRRDDLCVEYSALLNHVGQPAEALRRLCGRHFQPWEGGEGQALGQYVRACLALARAALEDGNAEQAVIHCRAALNPPHSLGEARHLLANPSDVLFWLGTAWAAAGQPAEAERVWHQAAAFRGDFQTMSVRAYSEMSYFSALSLQALGREQEARDLLTAVLDHAEALMRTPATIDYFATSLPTMLLFDDDLQKRQNQQAQLMKAQALAGLGQRTEAVATIEVLLQADPNNAMAIDLYGELTAGGVCRSACSGDNSGGEP